MTNFARKPGQDDLRQAILNCIIAGLQRTDEISARLNVSPKTISQRLNYMKDLALIHGVRAGAANIWRLGPALDEYGQPGHVPQARNCITRRKVILSTTYPAVGRRDSLVAALFGGAVADRRAPQQSAPRCTRCHMEQGTGHQAGCIVAMVAA